MSRNIYEIVPSYFPVCTLAVPSRTNFDPNRFIVHLCALGHTLLSSTPGWQPTHFGSIHGTSFTRSQGVVCSGMGHRPLRLPTVTSVQCSALYYYQLLARKCSTLHHSTLLQQVPAWRTSCLWSIGMKAKYMSWYSFRWCPTKALVPSSRRQQAVVVWMRPAVHASLRYPWHRRDSQIYLPALLDCRPWTHEEPL